MTPQLVVLSKHLKDHKTISQAEAGLIYKIRALPKRISELKDLGYEIARELKKDPTGQRYARYTLVSEPKLPAWMEDVSGEQYSTGELVTSNKFPEVGDRVVVVNAGPGGFYPNGAEGVVVDFYAEGKLDELGRALMFVEMSDRTWAVITDEVEVIVNV